MHFESSAFIYLPHATTLPRDIINSSLVITTLQGGGREKERERGRGSDRLETKLISHTMTNSNENPPRLVPFLLLRGKFAWSIEATTASTNIRAEFLRLCFRTGALLIQYPSPSSCCSPPRILIDTWQFLENSGESILGYRAYIISPPRLSQVCLLLRLSQVSLHEYIPAYSRFSIISVMIFPSRCFLFRSVN